MGSEVGSLLSLRKRIVSTSTYFIFSECIDIV